LIDDKLNVYGSLRKPYRTRKKSLFDSIGELVDLRNEFVHTGRSVETITDEKIKKSLNDFEVAADRVYERFGEYYGFVPSMDF
jgi:hypothetical protein